VVVAAQTDTDWSKPNYAVCVNVQNGKSYRVELAPADSLIPLAPLSENGVLLARARDPKAPGISPQAGPEKPEYWKLEPSTGRLRRVHGQFMPFEQIWIRPPQAVAASAGKRNGKIYAAFSAGQNGSTLGIYDLDRFRFQPILHLEDLRVSSDQFWVDESERTVYVPGASITVRLEQERSIGNFVAFRTTRLPLNDCLHYRVSRIFMIELCAYRCGWNSNVLRIGLGQGTTLRDSTAPRAQ
jgi:hypothetical protein